METYNSVQKRWINWSLLSLLIVATIGVLLRYKIAFALPFIHQKFLLHSHSHFAFSGWIAQLLMTLMVGYLSQKKNYNAFTKYNKILATNLITAYGMLIAFTWQGYGMIAVILSTLSIFISYWFTVVFILDLRRLNITCNTALCFKAGLWFNVFSSLGAFALAAMMINKVIHQNWYLAAEYFFLHFQYNGWFFLVCLGLSFQLIKEEHALLLRKIGLIFIGACLPTYFLSTLWMPLPTWLYILIVAAALAQLFAGFTLLQLVLIRKATIAIPESAARKILLLSCLAFAIKLILQAGSTIPFLSTFAFGFRPIVIGYLHLVLLGVTTLFLLGFVYAKQFISISKYAHSGLMIFAFGIIANELVLMLQGVAAISYDIIPFSNELLFSIAIIMCSGVLLLNISQLNRK